MSRTVELVLPPEKLEPLLPKIQKLEGFLGMRVQKNISVDPKGDLATFEITNDATSKFLLLMEQEGLLDKEETYITMTRPVSVLHKARSKMIKGEGSESSWEEVLNSINQQSNMALNGMGTMFLSGVITAYGIYTNSIHVVIGAMVIAPGFEPVSRMSLGLVNGNDDWLEGLKDTFKGYVALILGALIGAYAISTQAEDVLQGTATYLDSGALVSYWSHITYNSLIVSVMAAMAGGIIMMTNRSVLTAGVMIALALIPAGSLVGMALVEGNWEVLQNAGLRFLLEIFIVCFFTGIVFLWKRFFKHKRKMST